MCHPINILSADGEAQTVWALGIKNSIANYLQDGPDGKFYYRMVDTVLSRDKNWVRWKMENCHPFTRDRVSINKFAETTSKTKGGSSERIVVTPVSQRPQLTFFTTTDIHKELAKLKRTDRYVPAIR
jgi:THO complex subunit 1